MAKTRTPTPSFFDSPMSIGPYVVRDRDRALQTEPHYSDPQFAGGAKTVFLDPRAQEPQNDSGIDSVPGLSYDYSDRLHGWDRKKYKAACQAAKDAGHTPNSASYYEALHTHYHGKPTTVLHILAGTRDGYPYYILGYRYKSAHPINGVEFIQRAENGGWPLSNEDAGARNLGHGTPVMIVEQRSLVAFLHQAKAHLLKVGGKTAPLPEHASFISEIDAMLAEWDNFVFRDGLGPLPPRPQKAPGARGKGRGPKASTA